MADLTKDEQNVADALRLSVPAARQLLPTIQLHIAAAKAEMERVGVPSEYIDADGSLIQTAIIDYCMARMDDIGYRKDYQEAFEYQADCIRKSYKTVKPRENDDEK